MHGQTHLRNYSVSTECLKLKSDVSHVISHNYKDGFILECVVIEKKYINFIKFFNIIIGDIVIWSIPYEILKTNMTLKNNNYYINLNKDYFMQKIKDTNNILDYFIIYTNGIMYNEIKLILETNSLSQIDYKIFMKNILFHYNSNVQVVCKNGNQLIYQYKKINITSEKINLPTNNTTDYFSGFYLNLSDKLINLSVSMSENKLVNFCSEMIDYYNFLISENIIFSLKDTYNILKNILSDDICNIILEFLELKKEYIYYIPQCKIQNDIIYKYISVLKKNTTINIVTKNNIYDGSLIIKKNNLLKYENGLINVT